ncbi:hypothetical protein Tco_0186099 [Tanacetum coccineum]
MKKVIWQFPNSDMKQDFPRWFELTEKCIMVNLKRDVWNVLNHDVEAIRSRPPPNVDGSNWELQIKFWLDSKNAARAAKNSQNMAQNTIFCHQGSHSLAAIEISK